VAEREHEHSPPSNAWNLTSAPAGARQWPTLVQRYNFTLPYLVIIPTLHSLTVVRAPASCYLTRTQYCPEV
jgi:hypothetical protein